MAEAANEQIEKQVPELQDYLKSGIFSRDEVRQIVKRRRGYEYALRKRQTKKIDFMRYIQYEMNVETLRKRRKQIRGIHLKRSAPSELAIIKRLHFTFKRALLKYKGDISLWMQYFDFCESTGATKALGRAYATALQYMPLNEELWIKAAGWEWTDNENPNSARVLMQRGIRMNPTSISLWKEYLRLELLFWDRILRRKQIMGVSTKKTTTPSTPRETEVLEPANTKDDTNDDDDNDDNDDAEDLSDDDDEDVMDDDDDNEEDDDTSATKSQALSELAVLPGEGDATTTIQPDTSFLEGGVPLAVFHSALQEFSKSEQGSENATKFVLEAISVIRLFDNAQKLKADAYQQLGSTALAAAVRCQEPFDDLKRENRQPKSLEKAVKQVLANYKKELQRSPTTRELSKYLAQFVETQALDADVASLIDQSTLLNLCEFCSEKDLAGAHMYRLWAKLVMTHTNLSKNDVETTMKLICTSAIKVDESVGVELVLAWLSLYSERGATATDAMYEEALAMVKTAVNQLRLWESRITYSMFHGDHIDISNAFIGAIAAASSQAWIIEANSENMAIIDVLKLQYVEWTFVESGYAAATKVVDGLIKSEVARPGWSFIGGVVAMEMRQSPPSITRIRRLFEIAATSLGRSSVGFWIHYILAEENSGNPAKASDVYHRAVKTLDDPQEFIGKYRLVQTQG